MMAPNQLVFPTCPICDEKYDTEAHTPYVGCCGHSICAICINTRVASTCPICTYPRGFALKNKNQQLIETILMLQKVTTQQPPIDYRKQCGVCGIEVNDDVARTCVTCISCCESPSVDAFLAKAGMNRFCPNCNHLDPGHHLQRLQDVHKAVLTKQFERTIRFKDVGDLFTEMNVAVAVASDCFSAVEKQFPFGKRFDCTDEEEIQKIKSGTRSCFENAVQAVKEGVAEIYKMAERISAISIAMAQLPNVVDYEPVDAIYLEKIKFPERFLFRDKMPQNVLNVREEYKNVIASKMRNSSDYEEEVVVRDRYAKTMTSFFRFL